MLGNTFGVTHDGILYAKDAHLEGNIQATTGKIAGWRLTENYLVDETATTYMFGGAGDKTDDNDISIDISGKGTVRFGVATPTVLEGYIFWDPFATGSVSIHTDKSWAF
jgi:hypothetical protein